MPKAKSLGSKPSNVKTTTAVWEQPPTVQSPPTWDQLPAELKDGCRFVVWKFQLRHGKWTKRPYQTNGLPASSTNPHTWATFTNVSAAYNAGDYAGIGIALNDDGLAGIDLDHCIGISGKLEPWADEVVNAFGSYTETSPSGEGVRIFVRVKPGSKIGVKSGAREAYTHSRYLTLTGHALTPKGTVAHRHDEFVAFAASIKPNMSSNEKAIPPSDLLTGIVEAKDLDQTDYKLRTWVTKKMNGAIQKFDGDKSRVDMRLATLLLSKSGNDLIRADRIARSTPFFREKWDEPRGETTWFGYTLMNAAAGKAKSAVGAHSDGSSTLRFADVALAKAYLVQRYAYVLDAGAIWDRRSRKLHEVDHVGKHERHQMPSIETASGGNRVASAVELLLDLGEAKFDGIEYHPGKTSTVVEANGRRVLNTYESPGIISWHGDVSPLLEHVAYLFDNNQDAVTLILNFFAYLVQFPGEKIRWAPLHINPNEGTGRGWLFRAFSQVLGENNVFHGRPSRLSNRFNGWMLNTQLLIVPELYVAGTTRAATWNSIKPLITDDVLDVELKHRDALSVPNRMNVVLASQHNDATHIGEDDRRLFVWKSNAMPRASSYYEQQYKWLNEPKNVGAMLHHLRGRDLSGFNPAKRPPRTDAHKHMVESSRSALEQFLKEALIDRAPPFEHDLVNLTELEVWGRRNGYRDVTAKQLGPIMERLGAKQVYGGNVVRIQGGVGAVKKMRLWAVRPHPEGSPNTVYTTMKEANLAHHYAPIEHDPAF
jgi:hypothetical protein